MRGYKGTDANMRCRGMQYEVGKTYRAKPPIELCKNGLHFCEKLVDVFDFYDIKDGNRFFEVEASGQMDSDEKKTAAEVLTIIRELEPLETNRCKYGYGNGNGNGYGYGDGNGYGYGDGNGYGNGNGYGDGYGYGNIQRVLMFK